MWSFAGQRRQAYVIDVYDGDTITIAMDMTIAMGQCAAEATRKGCLGWCAEPHDPKDHGMFAFRLRLLGIDAPELRSKNPAEKRAAQQAKQFLASLILDMWVTVDFAPTSDKYGRLLGTVTFRHQNINTKMVAQGHARPYDGKAKTKYHQPALETIPEAAAEEEEGEAGVGSDEE